MKLRLGIALLLVAALAASSGCARVERMADPTTGDYYNDEEFQKLSKDQRAAYCAALADEAAKQQACADRSRGDLEREQAAIRDLEGELTGLTPRLESLAAEVDALERDIAYYEGSRGSMTSTWTRSSGGASTVRTAHSSAATRTSSTLTRSWPSRGTGRPRSR
jgi:uncharacterized protein YceK